MTGAIPWFLQLVGLIGIFFFVVTARRTEVRYCWLTFGIVVFQGVLWWSYAIVGYWGMSDLDWLARWAMLAVNGGTPLDRFVIDFVGPCVNPLQLREPSLSLRNSFTLVSTLSTAITVGLAGVASILRRGTYDGHF